LPDERVALIAPTVRTYLAAVDALSATDLAMESEPATALSLLPRRGA
jgi:hypothetical protein